MRKKSIRDLKNLDGKTVLVRLDLNVPFENDKITDNNRIIASLETIKYLKEKGTKIVLFSHLGRIASEEDKKKKSLKIVANELERILKEKVVFVENTRGEKLEQAVKNLQKGEILLVENTRFEDVKDGNVVNYESKCNEDLGRYWASLGDIFVNDAFGTLHRKHASNYGISLFIKEKVIGLLVEKELKMLNLLKENPEHPFVVILGGAKVSDKAPMITSMLKIADKVIIGSAMSYTFLYAKGHNMGDSLLDKSKVEFAKKLMEEYPDKLIIAPDSIAVKSLQESDEELKSYENIPDGYNGADIGDKSIELIQNQLDNAKTVFWNGPVGIIEQARFRRGSKAILDKMTKLENAITIIGGGDSALMASQLNAKDKLTYISTGGGASITYLEDGKMDSLELIESI